MIFTKTKEKLSINFLKHAAGLVMLFLAILLMPPDAEADVTITISGTAGSSIVTYVVDGTISVPANNPTVGGNNRDRILRTPTFSWVLFTADGHAVNGSRLFLAYNQDGPAHFLCSEDEFITMPSQLNHPGNGLGFWLRSVAGSFLDGYYFSLDDNGGTYTYNNESGTWNADISSFVDGTWTWGTPGGAVGDGVTMTISGGTGCPPAPVPTLGQWGLICFVLLLVIFGNLIIIKRSPQYAFAGAKDGNDSVMSMFSQLPFDARSYGKLLIISFLFVVAVFAIAIFGFGYSLTDADIPGTLVCTPLLAYLLFLNFME